MKDLASLNLNVSPYFSVEGSFLRWHVRLGGDKTKENHGHVKMEKMKNSCSERT